MGKKSRLKRERRESRTQNLPPVWEDKAGMHTLFPDLPGVKPEEMAEKLTFAYQKKIKTSPVWKQMIAEFGEEEAEKLLTQCKANVE